MRVRHPQIAERTQACDIVVDRSAIQRAGRKRLRQQSHTVHRLPAVQRSSARLSHTPPLDRGAIHDYGRHVAEIRSSEPGIRRHPNPCRRRNLWSRSVNGYRPTKRAERHGNAMVLGPGERIDSSSRQRDTRYGFGSVFSDFAGASLPSSESLNCVARNELKLRAIREFGAAANACSKIALPAARSPN